MNTHFITLESSRQIQGVKEELISTCDDLFIVTSGTEIEGIVTRKDLLEAFRTHPDDPMTVRNLVSKEYESMRPGDNLSRIVAKIRTNGQSSFPVIDGNEIKGIISLDSIQRFLAVQGSLNY